MATGWRVGAAAIERERERVEGGVAFIEFGGRRRLKRYGLWRYVMKEGRNAQDQLEDLSCPSCQLEFAWLIKDREHLFLFIFWYPSFGGAAPPPPHGTLERGVNLR